MRTCWYDENDPHLGLEHYRENKRVIENSSYSLLVAVDFRDIEESRWAGVKRAGKELDSKSIEKARESTTTQDFEKMDAGDVLDPSCLASALCKWLGRALGSVTETAVLCRRKYTASYVCADLR